MWEPMQVPQVSLTLLKVQPHLASAPASICIAVAVLASECHLRWKTDSLAEVHASTLHMVACVLPSFMTEAHLSKTVRQGWVQGSRGGPGATALCQCSRFCSEGVLGAGVWSCFLHGGRTMPLSPRPRCCCQSHREVIWLIIPMTIEWGFCLSKGGEPAPQKP